MMRAALSSSCHTSYQMTADTHRGPLSWQTAVSQRRSENEADDEGTKGGIERQEDRVQGREIYKGETK